MCRAVARQTLGLNAITSDGIMSYQNYCYTNNSN